MPFTITVTAEDAYGNVATGYTGTVAFTSTDGGAGVVLPGAYTFTAGDAGVASFSVTLVTAGPQTIWATDSANSLTGSLAITVGQNVATQLVVSSGASQVAGMPFTVTVTAEDAYGNVATDYTGTVQFASSDGQAVLPADSTLSSGTGTFSVTLETAGTQSITATDTVTPSITGSQTGITVTPAGLNSITIGPSSASIVAGGSQAYTAEGFDQYGNDLGDVTSTATFSVDGVAISGSSVSENLVGVYMVTASIGSVASNSVSLTVTPGVATQLVVSSGTTQVAGVAFSVTVTAEDAYGNVATGYLGTVTFTSSDTGAGVVLPGAYTFTAGDAGSHVFSVTLVTATTTGWVSGTDGVFTGTQSGITVDPAAVSTFSISTVSSPQTAGVGFSVTITALDAYGNTATSYTGTPTLSDLSGSISPTVTSAFVGGVWSATVTVTKSGLDSISASDGATTGTSNTFTVTHASAVSIVVSPASDSIMAGSSDSFTALATDAYGNSWDDTGLVTWSINTASGTWTANSVMVTGVGGWTVTATDPDGVYGTASLTVTQYEVLNTFTATGLSADDSVTLMSTQLGVSTPIVLDFGDSFSATVWTDSGTAVTFPATSANSGLSEQWSIGSPVSLTLTTGGNTYTEAYVDQVSNTFTVIGLSGSDSVVLTDTYLGAPSTIVLNSGNDWSASAWSDSGYAVTFPASSGLSTSTERWSIGSPYSTAALTLGDGTYSQTYYHQFEVTASYSTSDGSTPSAAVTLSGTAFGSSSLTALTTTPTGVWLDAGSSWSVNSQIIAGSGTEQWIATTGTSGTVGSATVVDPSYDHQYYLTVTSAYGSTTGSGWYNSGTTAYAGLTSGTVSGGIGTQYVFAGWGTDASGTNYAQSVAITMNSPMTATANWQTQYQLTFAVSGSGSTIPTGSNVWENAGSLSITATPNTGYTFSSWSSNTESITFNNANSASAMATIGGTGKITATFAINTYTITVTQTANGVIAPGTSVVDYGATPSFSITPNAGYYILSITANGASVTVTSASGQSYQFSAVSADGSLTATFATTTSTTIVSSPSPTPIVSSSTPTPKGSSPSPTPIVTSPSPTPKGVSPSPTPLYVVLVAVIFVAIIILIAAAIAIKRSRRKLDKALSNPKTSIHQRPFWSHFLII